MDSARRDNGQMGLPLGQVGDLSHHSSPSAESTMIRSPIRSRPSEVTSSPLGPNAKVSMPPSLPISTSTPDWMGSSSPDSRSAMICLSAVTPSRQPSCRSSTTLGPLTAVSPRTPAAAPNGLQRYGQQRAASESGSYARSLLAKSDSDVPQLLHSDEPNQTAGECRHTLGQT